MALPPWDNKQLWSRGPDKTHHSLGQADKAQTLSVTRHDICFSFYLGAGKSTCFISSNGSTHDALQWLSPFDIDGYQLTDYVMLDRS